MAWFGINNKEDYKFRSADNASPNNVNISTPPPTVFQEDAIFRQFHTMTDMRKLVCSVSEQRLRPPKPNWTSRDSNETAFPETITRGSK